MIAGDDLDRLRGGTNRETPPLALSGTLECGCKNVGRRRILTLGENVLVEIKLN